MALLVPGSPMWFRAAGQTVVALGEQDKVEALEALVAEIRGIEPQMEARDPLLVCLAEAAYHLIRLDELAGGDTLIDEVARLASYFSEIEPGTRGLVHRARALRAQARGDARRGLEELETAWGLLERAGDQRHACAVRSGIALAYADLGDDARAQEILREVVVTAERLGLPEVSAAGRRDLGRAQRPVTILAKG